MHSAHFSFAVLAHSRFERVQINVPVDTTREAPPTVPSGTIVPQPSP